MQTVLSLAPVLSLTPEPGAVAPPSQEGAFLASFEAEGRLPAEGGEAMSTDVWALHMQQPVPADVVAAVHPGGPGAAPAAIDPASGMVDADAPVIGLAIVADPSVGPLQDAQMTQVVHRSSGLAPADSLAPVAETAAEGESAVTLASTGVALTHGADSPHRGQIEGARSVDKPVSGGETGNPAASRQVLTPDAATADPAGSGNASNTPRPDREAGRTAVLTTAAQPAQASGTSGLHATPLAPEMMPVMPDTAHPMQQTQAMAQRGAGTDAGSHRFAVDRPTQAAAPEALLFAASRGADLRPAGETAPMPEGVADPEMPPAESELAIQPLVADKADELRPGAPHASGFWERAFRSLTSSTPIAPTVDLARGPVTALVGALQPLIRDDDILPRSDASVPATASTAHPSASQVLPGPVSGPQAITAAVDPAVGQAIGDPDDLERLEALAGFGGGGTGPGQPTAVAATVNAPGAASQLPVPQIAAQISAALSTSKDGATEIALSPEELGHVRLRLEPDAANPERMVVLITFERPETLDLFRRHAGELAEALRAAGYSGADIGFGQGGGGSAGSDGFGGHHPGPEQTEPLPPPPSAPRHAVGASLDLRL